MTEKKPVEKTLSFKFLKILLDVPWYLGWLASVLVLIITIAIIFGFNPEALQVQIPLEAEFLPESERAYVPMQDRPMIVEFTGYAKILVDPEDRWLKSLIVVTLSVMTGLMLWGLFQIRKFFNTVKKGEPFHKDNPGRIRWIGYLLLIGEPVAYIFMQIQAKILYFRLDEPTLRINDDLPFRGMMIIIGLIIIVIAQIFDIGVKMKREQDLTI